MYGMIQKIDPRVPSCQNMELQQSVIKLGIWDCLEGDYHQDQICQTKEAGQVVLRLYIPNMEERTEFAWEKKGPGEGHIQDKAQIHQATSQIQHEFLEI